jgi:hypothetical protein
MEVMHRPRVSASLSPGKKHSLPRNGEIVRLNRGLNALEKGTASCLWSELNHCPRSSALIPNYYAENAVRIPQIINNYKRKWYVKYKERTACRKITLLFYLFKSSYVCAMLRLRLNERYTFRFKVLTTVTMKVALL